MRKSNMCLDKVKEQKDSTKTGKKQVEQHGKDARKREKKVSNELKKREQSFGPLNIRVWSQPRIKKLK